MHEILFTESAAGSMKFAKGLENIAGEAFGFIYVTGDGHEPPPEEIQRERSKMEEERRIKLQNAVPVEGSPRDVVCFPLSLSMGDISDPFSDARAEYLQSTVLIGGPDFSKIGQELMQTARRSLERVLSEDQPLRIWVSHNMDHIYVFLVRLFVLFVAGVLFYLNRYLDREAILELGYRSQNRRAFRKAENRHPRWDRILLWSLTKDAKRNRKTVWIYWWLLAFACAGFLGSAALFFRPINPEDWHGPIAFQLYFSFGVFVVHTVLRIVLDLKYLPSEQKRYGIKPKKKEKIPGLLYWQTRFPFTDRWLGSCSRHCAG